MNFSFFSNVSEWISYKFGEYFYQIPIPEATTVYQPIPESLIRDIFPNGVVIPLPEYNQMMESRPPVLGVKRKRDDDMPRLAKPDTESPSRRIRLSGPSGLADISFFREWKCDP
jgi:hypothetical protein